MFAEHEIGELNSNFGQIVILTIEKKKQNKTEIQRRKNITVVTAVKRKLMLDSLMKLHALWLCEVEKKTVVTIYGKSLNHFIHNDEKNKKKKAEKFHERNISL